MPGKGLYMLLKKDTSFFFHQGLCQIVQMGSKWRSGSLCLLAILLLTIIDQRLAASIASQSRSLNKSIANSTTLAPQRKPNVTVLSSGTDQQIDSNSHFKPQISALIGRLVEHRKRGEFTECSTVTSLINTFLNAKWHSTFLVRALVFVEFLFNTKQLNWS